MATLYCCRCSQAVDFEQSPPESCPSCGLTLDHDADTTCGDAPLGRQAEPVDEIVAAPTAKVLGRYEIRSDLGGGGWGNVHLAYDPMLDRLVAIKSPNDRARRKPDFLKRFTREGRNSAQLRHPGIVAVYDVENKDDGAFIVSEYVKGEPLSRCLKRSRMSFRAAASMLAAVAWAVQYAHSKKIIHRDVKPSNIMIDEAGNPRLMDFGLAKREDIDQTVTDDEHVLGTLAYMSPEQSLGVPEGVDHRTDIYSLGVTLYQLLTGRLPFRGDPASLRSRVLCDEPPRPRTIDKQIPVDLETICLKAMEKNRERRYSTAGELAEDLERWLRGEPILARHISRVERAWRWAKRNPTTAGLVASIALLLMVSAGAGVTVATIAERARVEAVGFKNQETAARKSAEAAESRTRETLAKNQELLSRRYLEKAEQYIRAPESSDEYNPLKALPWMLAAMKVDKDNPARLLADRIGLQTQLAFAPSVERMWFFDGNVRLSGLSPKRDMFFVATDDGTVEVWRVDKDDAKLCSLAHPGSVDAAAFSSDGRHLATGSADGVRIWSIGSGRCLKGPFNFPVAKGRSNNAKRQYRFRTIAFSKSGQLVFAGCLEGLSQIWNVASGEPVGPAIAFAARQSAWAAFADSDRLVVVGTARSIRIYSVSSGAEQDFQSSGEPLRETALTSDGSAIAALGPSGNVTLWNVATGNAIGEALSPEGHTGGFASLAFSADGTLVATATFDGTVRLWSVSSGRLIWRQQVLPEVVGSLLFSPDASLLAVVNRQKKLVALAVPNGRTVGEPINFATDQFVADWIDSGRILAIGRDGIARLWSINHSARPFLLPEIAIAGCAAVSADRRVVAIAAPEGNVCVLRATVDGRFEAASARVLRIGDFGIQSVALTADGSRIAVSGDRRLTIWDTFRRVELGAWNVGETVDLMRFASDGDHLVCVSDNGRARVWNAANPHNLCKSVDIGSDPTDIDVDRDGTLVAVVAKKGVAVFPLAPGKNARPIFIPSTLSRVARFLNTPNRLLIACRAQTRIWDIVAAHPVGAPIKTSDPTCFELSDDKCQLLMGGRDGSARLWFVGTSEPASLPMEHRTAMCGAAIDASRPFVLTATNTGRIYLWNTRSAQLLSSFTLGAFAASQTGSETASDTSEKPLLTFFSPQGSLAHIVTQQGRVLTLELDHDSRSPEQIAADVASRSGTELDQAGALTILQQQTLKDRWKTTVHPTVGPSPVVSPPRALGLAEAHDATPATTELRKR